VQEALPDRRSLTRIRRRWNAQVFQSLGAQHTIGRRHGLTGPRHIEHDTIFIETSLVKSLRQAGSSKQRVLDFLDGQRPGCSQFNR
jgi:hypothetical protein